MKGKIVVVTGSSAGVGRATAVEFAKHGWRVALLARGTDGLEGARKEVEQAGGQALVVPTDVADHAQVEAAAEQVEREWGPIDVWVNNAMSTIFCDFIHIAPEDFRRATEVTYLGAVWGTLAALKRMKPRDRGAIVQVGSALAYRSIPLQAPYCGAKSAIRGFTDSLRSELIHDRSNVYLTMVHLSAFNTPQFDWGRTCLPNQPKPLGKIFQPEVAARGIYWAATHRRRELWVGWPAVQAILGTRVLPGFLDRMLAFSAYEGQEGKRLVSPTRRDNLYEPVPGDHGAHGRFDGKAISSSAQLWLTTHRWTMTGVALLLLLLLGTLLVLVAQPEFTVSAESVSPSSVFRQHPDSAFEGIRNVHGIRRHYEDEADAARRNIQNANRCSTISTAVMPTAMTNRARLLSSPVRRPKLNSVDTAGGCIASSAIMTAMESTMAVPPER